MSNSNDKQHVTTLSEVCDVDEELGSFILQKSGFQKHGNLYQSILFAQKNKKELQNQLNSSKIQKKEKFLTAKKKMIRDYSNKLDNLFLSNKTSLLQVEKIITIYSPRPSYKEKISEDYIKSQVYSPKNEYSEWSFPIEGDEKDTKIRKIMQVFDLVKEDAHKLLQKNNFDFDLTIEREKKRVVKQIMCSFNLSEQNSETLCSFNNFRLKDAIKCYMAQNQLFNFFTNQQRKKEDLFDSAKIYPKERKEEVKSGSLKSLSDKYHKEFVEEEVPPVIPKEDVKKNISDSFENDKERSSKILKELKKTYKKNKELINLSKKCVLAHLPPRMVIQEYRNVDYVQIDNHAVNVAIKYKKAEVKNWSKLFKLIVSKLLNKCEEIIENMQNSKWKKISDDFKELLVVRSIYRFVCEFLEYKDFKNSKFTTLIVNSKQAMCEGFADIFVKLCEEANVFAFKIHGKSKDLKGTVYEKTGHCWNAVFVGNYFFPLDATWSWGTSSKKFDDFWWLSYPEDFIMTHFPDSEHPQLQFLPRSINESLWRKSVFIPIGVQRKGIGILSHIVEEITFSNTQDAVIELKNDKSLQLVMELFSAGKREFKIVNGVNRKIRNVVRENERNLLYQNSISQKKTIIRMTFPRKNQNYLLKINEKSGSQKYSYLFKYEVTNNSIDTPIFPQVTEFHRNNNCFLHYPLEGHLYRSKSYLVKILVPHAIDVVLNEGTNIKFTTPLYKRNNHEDIFYGKIEFNKLKTRCDIITIFAHFHKMHEDDWMPLVIYNVVD